MLQACVASAFPNNSCVSAATHHLAAGGSRLRARICLDASERLGVDQTTAYQLASTCELLHNASLIHDDLLDRAPLRRAQPSVWALFGDGVAVCTGDLMLTAAYASAVGLTHSPLIPVIFGLVHRRAQEVILGQAAELAAAAVPGTTPEQYEILAQSKSASLLSLSLELPLCAAGYMSALAQAEQVAALFSVAYQIADDLEDVEQDRLANSLNLVDVLSASKSISVAEAKERAAARAEALLRSAAPLARDLPLDCAAVLVDHAEALLKRLALTTALTRPSAKG